MKASSIIIKKELTRVFSDRKLIFSLFILPAVIMFAMYGLMGKMISNMNNDIVEHISNVYIVNAPAEFDYVSKDIGYDSLASLTRLSTSEFMDQKVAIDDGILNGDIDLVVYFDPKFSAQVANYSQPGDPIPNITITLNSTENYSSQAYNVFSGSVLTALRTSLQQSRFGDLDLLTVFTTSNHNCCKEAKANSEFLSMLLPYMVVLMLFTGAMSIGVDAIAGEKERGTLASMLISPISRSELVFGKLVSLAIIATLSALTHSVALIFSIPLMGSGFGEIGTVTFTFKQVIQLICIMITLVYFFVSIVALLSALAKDSKNASSLISPCYVVVIMLGMMTMFTAGKGFATYKYAIPVYGSALAIKDITVNELTTGNFLAAIASSIVLSIILTFAITKAFNSEKIMFNA